MKINYLFRITVWVALTVLAVGCNPMLQEEVINAVGNDQIAETWDLKNTGVDGTSIVLGSDASAMVSKFSVKNFDLSMKMKTTNGGAGLLSFHTTGTGAVSGKGYNIMINNSDYRQGEAEKTGSLSKIRNFYIRMAADEEWFTIKLSVRSNHITVSVKDKIVSEYVEPEEPLRMEDKQDMVLSDGLIVLSRSNNEGEILVSEVMVEALPEDLARDTANLETVDEVAEQLTLLNQQGFPLIDFHGHLKGGLTMEEACQHGRDNGYNYGIAANCGLNFDIRDDSSLIAYYDEISSDPVFNVMQCEGREWVTFFSVEPVSQFDYIFSDAMTFTDDKGNRMRLWMRNEVVIEGEEQFMDMLVGKIETIVSKEPIDIYVNPTFLPAELDAKYDSLWTEERMDRVISVLADHEVALEINARYRIPSIAFIRKAKAAGVKFTLGTNNGGANDLGRLEYCLDAIREAGLAPEDIWLPRPSGQKRVLEMGIPDEITG